MFEFKDRIRNEQDQKAADQMVQFFNCLCVRTEHGYQNADPSEVLQKLTFLVVSSYYY